MSRNVIIHCHLFKNAGSTFDWSLERNFKEQFVDHRENEPMQNQTGYLQEYLHQNSELVALSSHHIQLPLHETADINLLPVFFLRNPIDRVGSVYEFERKQEADTPGAVHAKKLSFNDYIAWRMRLDVGATIRNFQVRFSSGAMKKQILTEEDLESSKQQLESSQLTGLVELYDESMVVFEEALKKYHPDIDLSYVRQNKGLRSKKTTEERISDVLSTLELEVKDELLKNNKFDLELYQFTESLVKERISNIEKFDQKLKNFRKRCSALSGTRSRFKFF